MSLPSGVMDLIKQLRKDSTTTGISTTTGLNYYNLEPQAKNIYPVFYPLLASIPRANPTFRGQKIGGTGANWKAIVGIDQGGYPAISEGNRNAFMNFQERDFYSPFKWLGKDVQVSFQAQETGLGFDDNIALAQLGQLNALLNGEERMILFGNSGSQAVGGNYGFTLGTPVTPTVSSVTTVTDSFGNATTANNLSGTTAYVGVVALTAWGVYLASSTGVKLPFYRTNADGSVDLINGGTSIYSAMSASTSPSGSTLTVKATTTAIAGAVAYAWYLSVSGSTRATAYFVGTTPYPNVLINVSNATNQLLNATDPVSSRGLSTDNSYNNLDFDGLMTWGWGQLNAPQPSYWQDYNGKGFTSNGDGTIAEFETVFDYFWNNYKLTFDKIYLGGNLISAASKAIITTGGGASAAQRIIFDRDDSGALKGGTKLVEYRSKYSNSGAPKTIPVLTHPWMPAGCVYFDLTNNPYPAAGGTIPAVRRILSLEDHFSIRWPYRKLQHEFGTYCFECLEHYIPFGIAQLTGLANIVN
jgi:hypothetical protein